MDRIFVRGLAGETIVGVHEWEQQTPRTVLVHLELSADVGRAARSDFIGDAINYGEVGRRVLAFLSSSRTFLIETLAERLAAVVLREFPVMWVRVELHKPGALAAAETVGVIIERHAADVERPHRPNGPGPAVTETAYMPPDGAS